MEGKRRRNGVTVRLKRGWKEDGESGVGSRGVKKGIRVSHYYHHAKLTCANLAFFFFFFFKLRKKILSFLLKKKKNYPKIFYY